MEWISINDRTPIEEQYVLWYYDSGLVIHDCITRDMGVDDVYNFFLGNKHTGSITHWCVVEEPKQTKINTKTQNINTVL